jgi:hypothetical protein
MYATETGGVWGTVTDVPGSPGGGGGFYSVSCAEVGTCTAVGNDDNHLPIYATESSGVWGKAAEVPGSVGGQGYFFGVSCTAVPNCSAVGNDVHKNGKGQPIVSSSMFGSPAITSFSPTSGPVGSDVTLKGTNLDGATTVSFNGVNGTIISDTPTKLKVMVPAGAITGKIKVSTPGGSVKTATAFRLT